jgi:hypothetical protein
MILEKLRQNPLFPQFSEEFGYNGDAVWRKASLHVLLVFPSPSTDKLSSRTPFTLYNIIKAHYGDDVFVDICMEPPVFQHKAYLQEFPVLVGAFSHHTWHDFDIIGISVAIAHTEIAEAYRILHKDGFPLSHKERLDDSKSPLLVLGGIAADGSNGLDNVVDLVLLGLGERLLPLLIKTAFEAQSLSGSVSKGKRFLIQKMKGFKGVCYPQDFPYGWHLHDGVTRSFPVWKDEILKVEPDTLLDMSFHHTTEDHQWAWPLSGSRRASVLVSWGCSGAGSCNFCAEGNLYGPWRERPLHALTQALQGAKRALMGETVSFQSFNSSYYSRFPELLMEAYKYFDLVSVLNFRLDELAASVRMGKNNYLALMREFGSVVVAGAVEGFGERVRNQLYNKNLSFDDIRLVAGEVFKRKFMKFKTGYILSGHETQAEMDEGLDEIKSIAGLKRELGSSTQYVVSVTKLVHYYGTPMYLLPRVMSYLNWMDTFASGTSYYPFFGLPRDLVSVKSTVGIGDTFVQQLHQDLPGELCEDILLRPALGFPVMRRGYLDEVKRRLESYGIKPKNQFLDFNPEFNPRQHYQKPHSQRLFERGKVFEPRKPCLNTLSTTGVTCRRCGACTEVSFDTDAMRSTFRESLLGRDISSGFDLSMVKAVRALNVPSFHYAIIFKVSNEGRLISKDSLVRLWFKGLSAVDPGFTSNFRRISYSFASHMDCQGFVSNYCGYEAVVAGFRDRVDLDRLREHAGQVNAGCPTIKFVSVLEIFEKPTVPRFWVLSELKANVSWQDMDQVLGCFLNSPFRYYAGSTSKFQAIRLPFYYKVVKTSGGPLLYVCLPGKANPAYNLMELWHYNKFNKMLLYHNIRAVLTSAGNHTFVDVVTEQVRSMSGFKYVGRVEDAVETVSVEEEINGA